MYFLYSVVFSIGFILMLPLFLLRREKYASGFRQRLGNYPEFKHDYRKVIWLQCVSVGETNAARPLVVALRREFPDHRLVISTTTRTGQDLARKIFAERADAIVYFPFDWKFSVRRALAHFRPSLVLLMETEIWPTFIHEAKLTEAKIAIVNGRLSQRSSWRYSKVRGFVARVLADIDLALMQSEDDAHAIQGLGMDATKIRETGNIKFDLEIDTGEGAAITQRLTQRFNFGKGEYLIVAASTHSPEEKLVLEAFRKLRTSLETKPRLLIAPRHPERFDEVVTMVIEAGFSVSRRSEAESPQDKTAEVIILDTIGELRAAFPLADVVFIGGSLIAHGGQSVIEPAAAGKAIVTGPHTWNFKSIVEAFLARQAIIQLAPETDEGLYSLRLGEVFENLLRNPVQREFIGRNAVSVMNANRGATESTVVILKVLTAASRPSEFSRGGE